MAFDSSLTSLSLRVSPVKRDAYIYSHLRAQHCAVTQVTRDLGAVHVLEKTLESLSDCKEIKPVNPKGNRP